MKTARWIAIGGAVVLSACQAPQPPQGAPKGSGKLIDCPQDDDGGLKKFCAEVSVQGETVVVDPPLVMVDRSPKTADRRVVWRLVTPGYRFKDDAAITLKGGSGEVPELKRKSDAEFRAKIKLRSIWRDYCRDYAVTVFRNSDNQPLTLDPTIANSYGLMDLVVRRAGAEPTWACR